MILVFNLIPKTVINIQLIKSITPTPHPAEEPIKKQLLFIAFQTLTSLLKCIVSVRSRLTGSNVDKNVI